MITKINSHFRYHFYQNCETGLARKKLAWLPRNLATSNPPLKPKPLIIFTSEKQRVIFANKEEVQDESPNLPLDS
jgi:hypothetical protein